MKTPGFSSKSPQREHTPDEMAIDQAIEKAARDSLIRNGFSRTTIAQVAREAGVSRPTVYARYHNVTQLAADTLTRELLPLAQRLQTVPQTVEELVKILVQAAHDLQQNELLAAMIERDPQLLQTYQFQRLGRVQTRFIDLLAQILEQMSRNTELRDEDPRVLAAIVVVSVQTAAVQQNIFRAVRDDADVWTKQLEVLLKEYLLP
ncbi:TetR/AcrR family transcriptional regulator [Mobiluncus curtisii]|uniref:Transcriptional regulator, TetR family n=2 Tax=Mobiluncus curtisii TaxID=2051 RepID=D6ZIH1_MOBCV|nr:TetR/AcrR family transcriptional regulator [Mobiluncus curtisii]ADI66520.1 transcriptional regulator, TetR family [Mobiluncus curtisii ATCC 43063]NMW88482.1 TetR/AcrR family transcriptional regulator [Mobiluncus curtisii]QQU07973.1 TetR/AcrR family transcriptional regulator [Mobiluncus curtisii]SQB64152.1 mycofactocin system transcriptional regulator [Mobiluncus curtisii]